MDKRHNHPMIFTSLTHGAACLYALEKAGKTIDDVIAFSNKYNFAICTAGNGDKWYQAEALNRVIAGES